MVPTWRVGERVGECWCGFGGWRWRGRADGRGLRAWAWPREALQPLLRANPKSVMRMCVSWGPDTGQRGESQDSRRKPPQDKTERETAPAGRMRVATQKRKAGMREAVGCYDIMTVNHSSTLRARRRLGCWGT